jgi:hypothetical protein
MYLISIEHTQVESVEEASEYDIQLAITKEFSTLNIRPEDVRIESLEMT